MEIKHTARPYGPALLALAAAGLLSILVGSVIIMIFASRLIDYSNSDSALCM